jgi:ADP-heptose:LPS heptosyltransferase
LRTFFKQYLFKLFNALSFLIPIKPQLGLDSDLDVVVLIQKPLGIGDLVMLSPLVILLEEKFIKDNIYIVTEYEKFIDFDRASWIHPSSLSKFSLANSIVISPMFVFTHLKYIFKSKYFIGYFFSNKLTSNFMKNEYKYSFTNGHYFKKIFPILDALDIEYDKEHLSYPRMTTSDLDRNSDDVVIAPYANWKERQFPLSKFVSLIHSLLKTCSCKIVLIGSDNPLEVEFNKQLEALVSSSRLDNQTGCTTLLKMSDLISKAKLYIGNDSGPSHFAYLNARKSLVFYGSLRFEDRVPLNLQLSKNITCIDSRSDCNYFPCYDGLSKPNCVNNRQYSCISNAAINNELIRQLLN